MSDSSTPDNTQPEHFEFTPDELIDFLNKRASEPAPTPETAPEPVAVEPTPAVTSATTICTVYLDDGGTVVNVVFEGPMPPVIDDTNGIDIVMRVGVTETLMRKLDPETVFIAQRLVRGLFDALYTMVKSMPCAKANYCHHDHILPVATFASGVTSALQQIISGR